MKVKIVLMMIGMMVLVLQACSTEENEPRGNEEALGMLENGQYEKKDKDAPANDKQLTESDEEGLKIVTEADEDDNKIVSVEYPKFEIASIDESIHNFNNEQIEVFNNLISADEGDEEFKASLNIQVTPTQLNEDVFALRFNINSKLNQTNDINRVAFMFVDIKETSTLIEDRLFDQSSEKRDYLFEVLNRNLAEMEIYSAYIDRDKLSDWVHNEANTFSNVDISKESVIFNFDQEEIASPAAGEPRLELLLEEVTPAMSDELVNFISEN